MEGAFLNTLGTVAEIPMEYEGNSGGRTVLKFYREEEGLRSLFLREDLYSTHKEAPLLGIFCRENREYLGEWRSIRGAGMHGDIPLLQRSSEPEVEGRARCLEEGPGIISVIGEHTVIVRIML